MVSRGRGRLAIWNQTEYPDDEVRALVRFAMKPTRPAETLVVVTHTRSSQWRRAQDDYWLNPLSGRAYNYTPLRVADRKVPDGTYYLIRLRVGRPDHFPMLRPAYRRGWGDSKRWPSFQHETWQEALVAVAAHEAVHNEAFREGRRANEQRCERFAERMLTLYRGTAPEGAIPPNNRNLNR